MLGGGGGVHLPNPTAHGANDLITINLRQVGFTAEQSKALSVVILGHASTSKMPRTGTFRTTAPAGVALNFAYDPSANSFSYVHSGPAASYTLSLSTLNFKGGLSWTPDLGPLAKV